MAGALQEFQQLTWLAHQRTDQGRRALLERMTGLFMSAPAAYTKQQKEYFGDIMIKLAYELECDVREELACRIADEINAPHELVKRLAGDIIPVARPVLERSPALTEGDLIQLARRQGQDHLVAITVRPDIRARLATVLCERGGSDVVGSLLRNDEADIATDTLQRLVRRAKGSIDLQSALVERAGVPKSVVLDLIDHVSDTLKEKLLDRLTQADRTNLGRVIGTFKAQAKATDAGTVDKEIKDLAHIGKLDQFALMRFISKGKYQHFMLGLSRIAGVGVPACLRILGDETGTALAIVCRANDFNVKTFKRIAMSPLTGISPDLTRVRDLVWTYNRLSRENARAAMKFWRTTKAGLPGDGAGAPKLAAAASTKR